MAKIKHTKNELKAQREALARFERFLPMLQLKKQQLQVEIQHIDARIADNDVIRDVSLFADRCDITEELTRLRCHIDQFRGQLSATDSPGRKLDFLCQEMFREINTIGSKANSIDISHMVVDLKTAVEKMREIVQNIE